MSDPDVVDVVVITGAGGMGMAIARRIGSGRTVILADAFAEPLERATQALRSEGYDARGFVTDVTDDSAVAELATNAAAEGPIAAIVHTAGVSAATSTSERILQVDLVGTAHIIDAFEKVATRGTSLVCIASIAGYYADLTPQQERALAATPAADLLALDIATTAAASEGVVAYTTAKRGNQVRVQAAALAWNRRGARINSISPGVIATPQSKAEAESASGDQMLAMLHASGAGRMGTPGEIANLVAFLIGPESQFISGVDVPIDGGQTAWTRWHSPR